MAAVATVRVHPPGRDSALAAHDALLATVALALTLGQMAHGGLARLPPTTIGPYDPSWSAPAPLLLAFVATLPLAVWRRAPLAVFAITATASAVLVALDRSVDVAVGPAVAIYLVGLSRDGSRHSSRRTALAATVSGAGFAVLTFGAHGGRGGYLVLHSSLAVLAAWSAGERTRLWRDQVTDLRERAHRAEREREQALRLAAAEERTRIARELHDSAGHAISTISLRAGTARLRHAEDPDRSLAALEAIEELARTTAADMDRIVGVLRTGEVGGPARRIEDIEVLFEHHRDLGHTISCGPLPQDLREIDGAVGEATYWIVQEAVANAVRHGTGPVDVALRPTPAALEVEVQSSVAPSTTEPRPGGGHGLLGMRERAELLGGSVTAGIEAGAFVVRARLPRRCRR